DEVRVLLAAVVFERVVDERALVVDEEVDGPFARPGRGDGVAQDCGRERFAVNGDDGHAGAEFSLRGGHARYHVGDEAVRVEPESERVAHLDSLAPVLQVLYVLAAHVVVNKTVAAALYAA